MIDLFKIKNEELNPLRDWSHKDTGTCVLGAGIKIKIKEPGKRKERYVMLMPAPYQGNIGSYRVLEPCLKYLNEKYPELDAFWDDGIMD